MKLARMRISEFQSIRDSNEVELGDITCLVGKNEAGKTAILRALYRLNPLVESQGDFDVTDDFPRVDVEDYKQAVESGQRPPANVVEATFRLETADLEPVWDELGNDVFESPELICSKNYANESTYDLNVNLPNALSHLLALPNLSAEDRAAVATAGTIDAAINALKAQPATSQNKSVKDILVQIQQQQSLSSYIYNKFLAARMPKFLYFDEYYQMKGQENIEALIQRQSSNTLQPSDYPMIGLIDLARLKLPELLNSNRTQELKNRIEGAGNHLSKQILKYWSQNKHLDLRFDVRPARPGDPEGMTTGTNIWAEIYDSRHKVTTSAATRSRGFIWFFSFLAWYSQVKRQGTPVILLLDEPGLSLHARAQEDLLRYFEEEVKGFQQLIYTTHSPFMVNARHIDRVRIVQDQGIDASDALPPEQEGTKIFTDILEATGDSLFPIQGALGYEIYQTLFVGQNSLVVEGVSELLYLQTISACLQRQGRVALSPDWTITPVGGSDKVATFVALIGAQKGMKIAALIDTQKNEQRSISDLYKKKLLNETHVFTLDAFVGKTEAGIEDMFDDGFFLDLVNSEFKAELQKPLAKGDLNNVIPKIKVRLEDYFRVNPMRNGVSYSDYRPARYFSEKIAALESKVTKETFERFEAAFKALNALL